jgi:hypothetical protein
MMRPFWSRIGADAVGRHPFFDPSLEVTAAALRTKDIGDLTGGQSESY